MAEIIPMYIKGKDDIVLFEPAPANQVVHTDIATAKAIAKRRCQSEC